MKVTVASSFSTDEHDRAVEALRAAGHDVFDYQAYSHEEDDAYARDAEALEWADACLLILPSGRAAHLIAGHFVGANKPLVVLATQNVVVDPFLPYLTNLVCRGLDEALECLAQEEVASDVDVEGPLAWALRYLVTAIERGDLHEIPARQDELLAAIRGGR